MTNEELIRIMEAENGYLAIRELPDGTVAAKVELMYTRAIILGCDYAGYESRFCFEDKALADKRFEELQSCDDEPAGFIARR